MKKAKKAKKALILASVASMIDQFNMPNIRLLLEMGYHVDVACNFERGSTCTPERIARLKEVLDALGVGYYQIDFTRSPVHLGAVIRSYRQVKELVLREGYTFIHCHSPIGGAIGRLVAKKTETPVIYTAHGFHFFRGAPLLNWLIYYPVEHYLSKYTDLLITINREDLARAERRMHAKRLAYIPGVGVDLARFDAPGVSRAEKRKELGIGEDALWLLHVGELSHRKNQELLIQAVAEMPEVHLTLVGRGEWRERFESMIAELGLEGRVRLLGFRSDIAEICHAADIFVFPSFQEGLPVALMEAMACGMPCACSRVRGNTDLIEEGKGGYFFSPSNVLELISAVRSIAEGDRAAMGAHNREAIRAFSIEPVFAETRRLYEEIGGAGSASEEIGTEAQVGV